MNTQGETVEQAPAKVRHELTSMVSVWGIALAVGLAVELLAPATSRSAWLFVGAGVCVFLAFVVQLVIGESHRFVARVAGGVVGAVVVIGVVSLVFWIPRFIAG